MAATVPGGASERASPGREEDNATVYAGGDETKLTEIRDAVTRFARNELDSVVHYDHVEDADDIGQVAQVAVWNATRKSDTSKFSAWGVGFTAARRRVKRLQGRRHNSSLDETFPSAEENMLAVERRIHIGWLLEHLSEKEERLVRMWMEQRSHAEIAEELGMSVGAVRTAFSRALQKLECLDSDGGE